MFRNLSDIDTDSLQEYKSFIQHINDSLSHLLTEMEVKKVTEHFERFLGNIFFELKHDKSFQVYDDACQLIIAKLKTTLQGHAIELLAFHSRQNSDYEYDKFKEFVLHTAYNLKDIHRFLSEPDEIQGLHSITNTLNEINIILDDYKNENKNAIIKNVKYNLKQLPNNPDAQTVLSCLKNCIQSMRNGEDEFYASLTLFADFRRSRSSLGSIISRMETYCRSLEQQYPQIIKSDSTVSAAARATHSAVFGS
jgi:hypothetical protein